MKHWLALLLILSMALSLVACSTEEPAATETVTPDVTVTEYLPFEGETLTVLYQSGSQADAARSMIPEFEAATGAKVQVVDLPYQDLYEQAVLDLISYIGSYDVINIDSQWDGAFAPYLEPLDTYIDRDKYDISVFIDNVLANCGQWGDAIIGIPTSCTPHVFVYRTDLIPEGIPAKWNDYRRVVSSAHKPNNGVYGIAVSKAPDQVVDIFNRVLWSMGGKWADENWKVTINSNEGRSALNYLTLTKNLSDPECLEWTAEDAIQAFLDGKAAVCETQALPEILQRGDDPTQSQIVGNWAIGLIPQEKTGITSLSAWDSVIPVGSQNKELAWEWIKMFTELEMQNRCYEEFTSFSARKDFWEQEQMGSLSVIRQALDSANNHWRISAFTEAEPRLSETLTEFFNNKIYQDTVIRRMDSAMKTILENMPVEEGILNQNY